MEARKTDRRYTYEDYKAWPSDARVELIDGVIYDMAPAPHPDHQSLALFLVTRLAGYLEGKPCQPYFAPTDLLFPEEEDVPTVVQPDIFVVCDKGQITDRGIVGAPRFIIEIVSPSNATVDFTVKRDLYERHGVPEYWIVDPKTRTVSQLTLANGRYSNELRRGGDVRCASLPGFEIGLDELFSKMDLSK